MSNRGVSPVDLTTPVGKLRYLTGDTGATPLDPAEAGFAGYANFSDDGLAALLAVSSDSITRAAGHAFLGLAAAYAAVGRSIKTDDLGIDTKQRGGDMLAVARSFFEQADAEALAESSNYFTVVAPFRGGYGNVL